MTRSLARAVGFAALVAVGGASAVRSAGAADDPAKVIAVARADEAKTFLPVLRAAVKGDHRRQAWYLASRIVAANPQQDEATDVLKRWKPDDLLGGEAPGKAFLALRDAAVKKAGAAYAAAVRAAQAGGAKPDATWGLVERALAFGNRDADVTQAIESQTLAWCGTWGTVKRSVVDETLGALAASIVFLPEWDDAFLRVRCLWPDAKGARVGALRVITGDAPPDAFARLARVAAIEGHLLATFGGAAKEEKDPERAADAMATLVAVPDADVFDAVVLPMARSRPVADLPDKASRWYDAWRRTGVAMRGSRDNSWIPPDALVSGLAAFLLVRHHWLVPAGGKTWDAGSWAFAEGFAGMYEGFVARGPTGGDLDPKQVWRLAVAKAARAQGAWATWEAILAQVGARTGEPTTTDLKVTFQGAEHDAKRVVLGTAQATALVWGLAHHDGAKGARRLTALVQETAKRGAAPDLDKAYGTKPGTVFRWLDDALDAWPGG